MVELAKLILQHHPNISITILVAIMLFDTFSYISSIPQTNLLISFLSLPPPSEAPPEAAAAATLGKAAFDYIRLDILKVLDGLKTMSHPLFLLSQLPPSASLMRHLSQLTNTSLLVLLVLPPPITKLPRASKTFQPILVCTFLDCHPTKTSHLPEPLLDRDHPAY